MACKGCTGVEMCNAGIDCIGMEHGAGLDCAGLAVGESRLQVNVVGNLEVCSNVGGVCACNEVCMQCLTQIASANDCVSGGVGLDYMVREFSIAGDTITINSAPEHTAISSFTFFNVIDDHAAAGANNDIKEHFTHLVAIQNPSLCRDMIITINASFGFNITDLPNINITGLVDGIAQITIGGVGFTFSRFAINEGSTPTTLRADKRFSVSTSTTIGPGVATNIRAIAQTALVTAGDNFNNGEFGVVLQITGVTV